MILVDSNVVVALMNPLDEHNETSLRHLSQLSREPLFLVPAVLSEIFYLLQSPYLRAGLRRWMRDAHVQFLPVVEQQVLFEDVWDWLEKYEEHLPDWADGCLAVISGINHKAKVWTYDSEFKTIWRRPDGSRIPLAV